MSAKRRGLGRGLGALIPTGPELDEQAPGSGESDGAEGALGGSVATAVQERPAPALDQTDELSVGTVSIGTAPAEPQPERKPAKNNGPRPSTVKWDSAIASGRLSVANEAVEGGSASALDDTFFSRDQGDVNTVSRETPELLPVPGARFAELPVTAIRPNTWQPRTVFDESDLDELVDSIREIGVLQPIVVRPDKEHPGEYELIMGERRWRATQAAELETIPAIVRDTDDGDMLRDALLENLHRSDLNPLEEA
ncbi:ParB/RepB/Spo0J family partition protein, partial [Streptomyces griseoincarnatus]